MASQEIYLKDILTLIELENLCLQEHETAYLLHAFKLDLRGNL
jgi:hypothetical protein